MRKLIISLAAAAAPALAQPVPGHAPVFPVAPRVWRSSGRLATAEPAVGGNSPVRSAPAGEPDHDR